MKKSLLLIALGTFLGLSVNAQTFSGGDGSSEKPYVIATAADLLELSEVVTAGNDLSGKMLIMEKDITVSTTPMIGYTGDLKPKHFAGTFDGKNHQISGLKFNTDKQYCGLFAYVDAAGTIKNLTLNQPTMTTGQSYGGFIAAASDGLIENCHVANGVFESTNGSYKGGVIGQNKGLVTGCTYTGSITSSTNAGGIIGQNYSQIEKCNSSATIVSTAPNQNNVQFGGITGITIKLNSDPHIYDCYFTGNIEGASTNNCGGITGTLSGAEMLRCWNGGYISSTGSCGALTNTIDKASKIKDCYNVGTIYDTYSDAVGGLIGTVSTDKSEMSIENCLNMGVLFSAITARHEGMEFAGSNYGSLKIINSYYDSQITGVYGTTPGGMSTDKLTSGETLSGFDSSVWKFTAGLYPRLANTASTDVATLGAAPIFLAAGETSNRVTSDFTVSTANDVEWELTANAAARLNGNKVIVTRGSKKVNVVLTAYLGNYSKRALISVYPIIFEGQGTKDNPYLIATAQDMMKLSDATNAQELDFTGEYFKMTGDIDMTGMEFVPMAFNSAQLAFNGVFDGDGHSIKNLSLDSRTNSVLNTGLFRTVYAEGVVKNLTIDKSCKFDIYRNFAPFVSTLYGTVENCRNYADINTTNGFSGGIVYLAYGSDVKIINCYNEGNLVSTVKDGYMGGIAYTNEGLIENCQNNGNIMTAIASTKTVAGISAVNKGTIKNVINTGHIKASAEVGGIVSDSKAGSTITNALSIGQVEAFTSRDALGSVVAKDAGAIFTNVYYDEQVVLADNSLAGITGLNTSALTADTFTIGDEAWSKTANRYPVLKLFADEVMSQLASMPVWFADGQHADQLSENATLATADDLKWSVGESLSFKVEGNQLIVTNTDTYNTTQLSSSYKGAVRSIEIGALAKIFAQAGTETDPYLIESVNDLKKLAADIESSGMDYAGKFIKLVNDLDLNGEAFKPIAGDGLTEFKGSFDGNNKTISNLKISTTTDGTGLFGRVGLGGVIKNLTIDANSSVAGKSSVGGFVGMLNSGTVDNCVNMATVSATATTANIGGIIGQASGTAVISNCKNTADITAGKSQTGGIVGYANGTEIKIINASNEGKITGTTKTAGIAGYITATTIDGAINTGEITGTTDVAGIVGYTTKVCAVNAAKNLASINGGTEVGGVVGYASADMKLTNSYNAGAVIATASTAGGLMARGVTPEISASFNVGDVTNTKTSLGSTTPGAAGVLGKGDPIISDVYNMGTVTAEKNLGGFIGSYNVTSKTATITRSYQGGKIVSTIEAPTNMDVFVGRVGKVTYTNAYYDKQIVYNLTNENATAVTTAELAKVDLGENWTKVENALPILNIFSDDNYARLYSAPVFLAADNNISKVSDPFTVSNAYGVKWAADNTAFKMESDKVTPLVGVAGNYALTASLGNLSRVVTLTLTGVPSGVNSIASDSTGDAQYYNLQGIRVNNPVAGMIYVVVRGQKVTKEVYK